jgi:hypothetical protein
VVPFTEVGNQMKNEAIKSGTTTNKQGKFNKCNAHNYCYSSRWKKSGTWTTITSLRYSRRRTFKFSTSHNNSLTVQQQQTPINNGSYQSQLHLRLQQRQLLRV